MQINVKSSGGTSYALLSVEARPGTSTVIVARSARGSVKRFTRKQLGSARFNTAVAQHIAALSAARKVS